MRVYGETNIGKKRTTNQDTFRMNQVSSSLAWTLVCDGMGGVNGGDVASSTAAEIISEILNNELNENLSHAEIKELMFYAINEANSEIFSKSVEDSLLKGMGTTVVLALSIENTMFIAHVGDSRAYIYRSDVVKQITQDHSYVQDLINRGEITEEEAKNHPHKNIITRSLGVHSIVEIDLKVVNIQEDDVFLVCSDGLSSYLEDETLIEFINTTPESQMTERLIDFALECGGSDNVTVTLTYC